MVEREEWLGLTSWWWVDETAVRGLENEGRRRRGVVF